MPTATIERLRTGSVRVLRHRGTAPLAGLLVLVALIVGLHIRAYPTLSPIDELHHVDYMIRAADGVLLRRGDVMVPETRREGACRGVDAPGQPVAACDDEGWLAGREFNTEEIQPPGYYFITGWTARVLRPFLGTSSLVTAGRMVGALWLAAGVLALWAALAFLGVRLLVRAAVGALLVSTPVVLHASTVVTNDATAFLAGALPLAAVLAWERRRVRGLVVVLAVVLCVSLRLTNALGTAVVAVYLLVRALGTDDDPEGRPEQQRKGLVVMAGVVLLTAMVTGLAWVALNSAVARVGPLANPNTFNQQACCGLPLDAVLGQLGATVTPIRDPYLPPFLRNNVVRTVVSLTDWILIGAAVGVALLAARASRAEALALSAAFCALATGPVLTLTNYIFQGAFYGIPARYGLSILPALGVALALALTRGKVWSSAALAGLSTASVAVVLIGVLR